MINIIIHIAFSAAFIFLVFCLIYVFIDRNRWRRHYQEDLENFHEQLVSMQREFKDELGRERVINIQLKDKVEKYEGMLSGYRKLLSEVHATLSQSVKMDYKMMSREVRMLVLQLVEFAKKDDTLTSVEENERKKQAFIKMLMERYPDITEASAQLAYMISINMPAQDISKVLGINVKSVQMARFRLRKRLGLTESDSLEEHLRCAQGEGSE